MDSLPTKQELLGFLSGLVKRWVTLILAFVGCSALALYEKMSGDVPPWLIPVVAAIGLIAACFSLWRDQERIIADKVTEIATLKGSLEALSGSIRTLKTPRFKVRCEDGGTSSTVNHGATITISLQNPMGSVNHKQEPISLFCFAIKNLGIDTAKNCRAHFVRIEKSGNILFEKTGALGMEARNLGDDVELVDLPHDVEQHICACSVSNDNRVMVGVRNAKWRHGSIHELFKQTGDYDIFVDLSSDGIATQHEHFTFSWRGKRHSCQFRHVSTNGIKT